MSPGTMRDEAGVYVVFLPLQWGCHTLSCDAIEIIKNFFKSLAPLSEEGSRWLGPMRGGIKSPVSSLGRTLHGRDAHD